MRVAGLLGCWVAAEEFNRPKEIASSGSPRLDHDERRHILPPDRRKPQPAQQPVECDDRKGAGSGDLHADRSPASARQVVIGGNRSSSRPVVDSTSCRFHTSASEALLESTVLVVLATISRCASRILGYAFRILGYASRIPGYAFRIPGCTSTIPGCTSTIFRCTSMIPGCTSTILGYTSTILRCASTILGYASGFFDAHQRFLATDRRQRPTSG